MLIWLLYYFFIFQNLGSSEIQNLQFRGQWYFITQHGMTGGAFTPYEQLEASRSGIWTPIDKRICIPRQSKKFWLVILFFEKF